VTCTWGEAVLLEQTLRDDPTTHYGAAVFGWSWPSSIEDVASTLLAAGVLSYLMPEGKSVTFPMPWDKDDTPAPPPQSVVDEMKARLEKYSAFAD
jgi:hypothetical protein